MQHRPSNFYVLGVKPDGPGRFAVTVHRVQGATLEGDVHVLLNSEFFADGQAVCCHPTHVALSWSLVPGPTRQLAVLRRLTYSTFQQTLLEG